MKTFTKILLAISSLVSGMSAHAQYYQLANQLTDMIGTAVTGGANYRGYLDVSYLNGVGPRQANFVELSTTQGLKYGNIFFMGVGAGISRMSTEVSNNPYMPAGNTTQTAALIPLFTDFRLNFGQQSATGVFIDLRLGAAFYASGDYILVGDGYINSSESFYLRPSVGVRIPVSKNNSKLAFNLSATYQLLTSSYWYNPGSKNDITLSSFGVCAAFEW